MLKARSRSESESEQGEKYLVVDPKPDDLTVEIVGDDLWLAEKFQTNRDIAGSPRNSFRASLVRDCRR